MDDICIITDNQHKYLEIAQIANEYGIRVTQCPGLKIEIQHDSLEEIAYKSAILAYLLLNRPLLVEDAGLFIESLNGFPGPYSNYVYKTIGIRGILKLLMDTDNRKACFKSAVALAARGKVYTATGEVCGEIALYPRGEKGFGFDPIFIPSGQDKTFAEMELEEKNRYSHRAMAVRKVFKRMLEENI